MQKRESGPRPIPVDRGSGEEAGKTAENKAKKGKGKKSKKSSDAKKKKEKKESKEEPKEEKHGKKEEKPEKKEEKSKPEEPQIKTDKTMATEENKEEEKKEEGQGDEQKGDEKPTTPPPPADEKKEGEENKDEEGKEDKKEEGTGGKEGGGEEKLPKFSTMQCEWDEKGGKQTVTVTNTSDVKMGLKIKTSDNNLFRVEPVFANIEAGKSLDVAVIRSAGTVKEDKVLILLTENKGDEDLEKLFKKPDVKITTTTIRQIPKGAAKAASEKGKAASEKGKAASEKGKAASEKGKAASEKGKEGTGGKEAKVEDKLPKFSVTQIEWDEKGGKQIITVTNPSDDKMGMKIKTSDNNLFRVEPVFANIEPGKSLDVAIIRSAGAVKEDKVLILLTQNKADEDLEKLFKKPDVKITTTTIPQTAKKT
ncbi:hypothetical protein Aduo_016909 [Ancylostoma duodenale]